MQNWSLLVQEGDCCCRKVVTGEGLVATDAELVVAAAGKWSPVHEGSCWCRFSGY